MTDHDPDCTCCTDIPRSTKVFAWCALAALMIVGGAMIWVAFS